MFLNNDKPFLFFLLHDILSTTYSTCITFFFQFIVILKATALPLNHDKLFWH